MVGELEGRDEISRRDFLTDRLSTGWGRAVTECSGPHPKSPHSDIVEYERVLQFRHQAAGCEKEESLKK